MSAPPWSKRIVWRDDGAFRLDDVLFVPAHSHPLADGAVIVAKDQARLDFYAAAIAGAQDIVALSEDGGAFSTLLALGFRPRRLIGLDSRAEPAAGVISAAVQAGLDPSALRWTADPSDHASLRSVTSDRDLDLIAYDSHKFYEPALSAFEALFPRLRENGVFVLDGWGWAHWPGDFWQSSQNPWWSRIALSNLVLQLTLACASKPEWVAGVSATSVGVVIRRGPDPIPDETPLETYFHNRLKRFPLL